MDYAKIIVKSDYEKRGDLVLRSYVRALKKVNAHELLDGDNGIIFGSVDEHGRFYEFFTKEIIDYDDYILIPLGEYIKMCFISESRKDVLKKLTEKIIFEKDVDLDFEISTIEESATDRSVEFEAYNNYLSRINPYMRLDDDQNNYFAYNSFQAKVKELKKMAELDRKLDIVDEYDIHNYENPSKVFIKK